MLAIMLALAVDALEQTSSKPFSKTEKSDLSKILMRNLLAAFDAGERDPVALKGRTLAGVTCN
jgi:hypothetical protein